MNILRNTILQGEKGQKLAQILLTRCIRCLNFATDSRCLAETGNIFHYKDALLENELNTSEECTAGWLLFSLIYSEQFKTLICCILSCSSLKQFQVLI